MSTAVMSAQGTRGTTSGVGSGAPPLSVMSDLLSWRPSRVAPLAWRDAFDAHLHRRASTLLAQSDPDGCLEESLALLPEGMRRRFLRAPVLATRLCRPDSEQFDARFFAELLLAELAAAGVATELPESRWTARGDRFLDRSTPEGWTVPGATLGDTGISINQTSPCEFPDDEFGIPVTELHDHQELELVLARLLDAVTALRRARPAALTLVTTFTEVLALRREPARTVLLHSSTFSGYPGLVRLTNGHLPGVNTAALVESLVHEAIHCILHVHEEVVEPFVRTPEANHTKLTSPWTGATIRLQSYVHACAVWYGLYWLWSTEAFAGNDDTGRVAALRQRALQGFLARPVSVRLSPLRHLLARDIGALLEELEARMLCLP